MDCRLVQCTKSTFHSPVHIVHHSKAARVNIIVLATRNTFLYADIEFFFVFSSSSECCNCLRLLFILTDLASGAIVLSIVSFERSLCDVGSHIHKHFINKATQRQNQNIVVFGRQFPIKFD